MHQGACLRQFCWTPLKALMISFSHMQVYPIMITSHMGSTNKGIRHLHKWVCAHGCSTIRPVTHAYPDLACDHYSRTIQCECVIWKSQELDQSQEQWAVQTSMLGSTCCTAVPAGTVSLLAFTHAAQPFTFKRVPTTGMRTFNLVQEILIARAGEKHRSSRFVSVAI